MDYTFSTIARIENDFTGLFGIPRQSGICNSVISRIVWEKGYASGEALRGLECFSHLWLLWVFSEHVGEGWHPTVRPPKLGGNVRVGVYASRSPYRPNPIGMSIVKLLSVEKDFSLVVSGADLMNGTPILDIKPYLPYSDMIPEAAEGFAPLPKQLAMPVEDTQGVLDGFSPEKRQAVLEILSQDPRPGYVDDPERVFCVCFGGEEIHFTVREGTVRLRKA